VVRNAGLKANLPQIRNILKDNWKLRSDHNSDYTFYSIGPNGEISPLDRKGRYLEVGKEVIDKILL
jgi:hypothetical protein